MLYIIKMTEERNFSILEEFHKLFDDDDTIKNKEKDEENKNAKTILY